MWLWNARVKDLYIEFRAIAAGLSMKLIVTFETATLDSFADSLKIVTDS
mgnify:CR=1 FL=1